jgi:hypothetical protein
LATLKCFIQSEKPLSAPLCSSLGAEALERFVHKEPLRRARECVFGVLALESEPVDPRL